MRDIYEELKSRAETPEFSDWVERYVENYLRKKEQSRQRVSSKEYIDWIYNYVSTNKHIDNESALYVYEGIDAENGKILSAFLDYIEELARQQNVSVIPDDECCFGNEQVVVKIKDKYFKVFRMYGQGTWISVDLLDEEPNDVFVKTSY